MTQPRPTVSAIIPVYNGQRYLAETLDSVLSQTLMPDEIICVDDGSTDSSPAIIQQYPQITYLVQENAGVAAARNTALKASHGELIAFLDQDDLWIAEKTELQTAFMQAHPEVDIVSSHVEYFLQDGMEKPDWLRPTLLQGPQRGHNLGNCLIRRGVFDRVGMFDSHYITASDHDWFSRAKDDGASWHTLPDVLLRKRVHDQNESRHTFAVQDLLHIHRRSVERKKHTRNQDEV